MHRGSELLYVSALALFALVGCNPTGAPPKSASPEATLPEVVKTAPAALTPSGPSEALKPGDSEEGAQASASVVELTYLQKQGDATVKLFGTAGGDPAMNGLYTYLAFYQSPADGWRVFKLGDFLEYRLLSEAPGRIDLELQQSVMDEASGNIGSVTKRVIVEWKPGTDGAAPEMVSVTPAK